MIPRSARPARLLLVMAALAWALAASGCNSGNGEAPTSPAGQRPASEGGAPASNRPSGQTNSLPPPSMQ